MDAFSLLGYPFYGAVDTFQSGLGCSFYLGYYEALLELSCLQMEVDNKDKLGLVGAAALGGGFTNMAELKPMKYEEVCLCGDWLLWEKAINKEHERHGAA